MVHRGAAVVPAAVGVSAGFQEDLGTLEVPVDHSYVEGGLSFHVHQVDLSPFAEEEVDAGPVAGGGRNAQRRAGQPATAPHRLLVDPAGIVRGESVGSDSAFCILAPPHLPQPRRRMLGEH